MEQSQQEAVEQVRAEDLWCNDLEDITAVSIQDGLSQEEKRLSFLEQIKNPYCFRCGDTPVRLCFDPKGTSLEEALQRYLIRLRQR